ncbi:quinoprotein dehydrogenase-associated SoxYZ-like carrier [Solimonas variicoloris]|uniref:quinoprotein dehydrogenase-associated SoxYZ-like carrier n=1 Tax=Solimonas variicoloris TaxID=254408 RepID=UPI00036542BB|nr:quinoprotein dehydrogenase-associated SoxYZ-like carrier [Solimonas variicoloris]
MLRLAWLFVAAWVVPALAAPPDDPLRSPAWPYMAERYFAGQTVRFDAAVRVLMPGAAEDPLAVPVYVDAGALADVREILVFADLNPITTILRYEPGELARPSIGFRFKVQQATPLRAAARTGDGVWHLGGAWLNAGGGGCTTPSQASGSGLWKDRFGEIDARLWPRADGLRRLRLQLIHPMDTGLAGGIPAFYLETLALQDSDGRTLARLQTFEPVAENPLLSFDLRGRGAVSIRGRDTQANRFAGTVAP